MSLPAVEEIREITRGLLARLVGEARVRSAARFLEELGWISLSFSLARLILGATSVLAASLLGPSEYGRFNLVMAVGPPIATLMLCGMNASILQYGNRSEEARPVFGTSFRIVAGGTLVASLLVLVFGRRAAEAADLSPEILWLGWVYAVAMTWYSLATSMQQAQRRFAARGWTEILLASVTFTLFIAATRLYGASLRPVVWAYLAAYAVAVPAALVNLLSLIRTPALDPDRRRGLLTYGLYTFGCGAGSFLTSHFQTILLNALLSSRDVGVYSAHRVASISMATFAVGTLHAVLFSRASASTNRWEMWGALWRTWRWIFIPTLGAFCLAQMLVLWLIGRTEFEASPGRIALFALCATVVLLVSSLGQVVGAEGLRGARLGLALSLTMGGLSLLGSLILIPRWQIEGAVASITMSYAVGGIWLCCVSRRYCR